MLDVYLVDLYWIILFRFIMYFYNKILQKLLLSKFLTFIRFKSKAITRSKKRYNKKYLIIFIKIQVNQRAQYYNQMQGLLNQQTKADKLHYEAFARCTGQCRVQVIVQLGKFIILFSIILINLSLSQTQFNDVLKCIYINVIVSFAGFAIKIMQYILIFKNINNYLLLSQLTGHNVFDEKVIDASSIQSCTSDRVFSIAHDVLQSELDELNKRILVNGSKNILQNFIREQFKWIKPLSLIFTLSSIATLIFTIIVLVENQSMESYNKFGLIFYAVVVGMKQVKFIAILIIIGISPVICLGALLCFCCCRKNHGQFIDLPIKKATNQDINNVGGDCSICMQSVIVNEDIYVLPCSQKHLFHSSCIRHWTKMKNTCPICRKQIPMTNTQAAL